MKVVLSIKPEFANKIFEGNKKFEFRRALFKDSSVKTVVVYASAPISKVIGEFEIEEILHKKLDVLWQTTHADSGITKDYYLSYFKGKESGYAIKIKNIKKYKSQYCIKEKFGLCPPQSFAYLKHS